MRIIYSHGTPSDLPQLDSYNPWAARAMQLMPTVLVENRSHAAFGGEVSRFTGWTVQGSYLVTGDRCGKGVDYDVLPKGEQRRPHARCSAQEVA